MNVVSAEEPEFAPAHAGRNRRTEQARAIQANALARLDSPVAWLSDLANALARRVRERPTASLAVAIGVGFLVGGALSFRAGRMALAVAVRRVAREVLKQVL